MMGTWCSCVECVEDPQEPTDAEYFASQLAEKDAENAELKKQRKIETERADYLQKEYNKVYAECVELKRQLAERDGWQLVPKEPTNDGIQSMVNAGAIMLKQHPNTPYMENRTDIAKCVYKAMLAAAPKQCRHYPEEFGPSDNRQLACSCGNPNPSHLAAPKLEDKS